MGQRGHLDRIPVAHTGPILSVDWYNPQSGVVGLPSVSSEMWVATGGLDRCVKVTSLLLLSEGFWFTVYALGLGFQLKRWW
jgi:hypothetical protein